MVMSSPIGWAHTQNDLSYLVGCPHGWTPHGDMCYMGSVNEANARKARTDCETLQAFLASVHDEETATFIHTLMNG